MFNVGLRKDAVTIHENSRVRYNSVHEIMVKETEKLYKTRKYVIDIIVDFERIINSIANKPKEFDKKMGLVCIEIRKFRDTEEYVKEALEKEIKAGLDIAAAAAGGMAFAGMAPSVAMQIATTFGKASTGTAIKALSGAAAQKAALAWLGGGALSAGGAGIAGGQALLALAGPIGWSLSGAAAGISLISMSRSNKEIADRAIDEAKKIMIETEHIQETTKKVENLKAETDSLYNKLKCETEKMEDLYASNYQLLNSEKKLFLGAIVNNLFSLSCLLNKTVE